MSESALKLTNFYLLHKIGFVFKKADKSKIQENLGLAYI